LYEAIFRVLNGAGDMVAFLQESPLCFAFSQEPSFASSCFESARFERLAFRSFMNASATLSSTGQSE
jgi:hypothetical protein